MSDLTLVDTDILIDCLRGRPEALEFLEGLPAPPLVSCMSVAELYAGVRDSERTDLDGFLGALSVLPLDDEASRVGGLYRRDFGPSHGTGLVDGIIAATAVSSGARLATLSGRHYPMLDDVCVPY